MDINTTSAMGILSGFFVLYWCLLFQLIKLILGKSRLKKAYNLPLYLVNVFATVALSAYIGGILTPFVIMATLMLLEFSLLYKSTFVQNVFCTCACILHVLAIRTTVSGVFSFLAKYPASEIPTGPQFEILSGTVALILLDLAIVAVIKLIPLDRIRIINQHKEQQWFLVAWMMVNNGYLLYHTVAFPPTQIHLGMAGNQIIAPLSILFGLYIVLFFAIKTVTLLGYQEENAALTQAVLHEQQYRNSILKDALASYEINLTQDTILYGFEAKRQELGDMTDSYSDMLNYMTPKIIHPDDMAAFIELVSPSHILYEFEHGKSEITIEYRRLMENGTYIWVTAVANLIRDLHTGDLLAYVYIKDIDEEKKRRLELQAKAERDPLTGLYNKELTGKLIDEALGSEQESVMSALFIVDVDNFKEINDHLGHLYGDAVLCELGDKLRNIFRNDDIVGRIGGDEFIAYIKNCNSTKLLRVKAQEICKVFRITYKGLQGEVHSISGSVGIALFPKDGHNFEELYKYADFALYKAKNDGKSRYQLYDGSEFTGYESCRTKPESDEFVLQKSFRQNRIEYVFKILYQSENAVEAIHSALELVASHFSFERGYIFETSEDGKTTSNTFEWCADGVRSQINHLQEVPIEAVSTANKNFRSKGFFVLKSLDELEPPERAVLEPQGIKSMFQFGIFDKNHLLGFIGFDNCRSEALPCPAEIDEIATICNILATFFVKQHIDEVSAKDLQVRQEVMNHLNNYIYVINPGTFEVLFMNQRTQALMQYMKSDTPCYWFFRGKTEQCEDCPIRQLYSEHTHRKSREIYNEKLDLWMETTASTLRWTDGSLACLINCADISKQKEERLLHVDELERLAFVDELTGCRTYHKFKEDARRILEEEPNMSHFIVKFDIDNFKLVNQIYGYEKGDYVLRCVTRAIEQTTRTPAEIFARIVSDEFIGLFAFDDRKTIFALYETFLRHFHTFLAEEITFQFIFPHGLYLIKQEDLEKLDINDLFERANMAHKAAKQDKSQKYVIYDESMTEKALRVKEIENKMEDALKKHEFVVYLQPKYNLDSEMVGGAEALTRWKNEDADLFLPCSFIPIFEKNGFIRKLDFYILDQVCRIIKGWTLASIEPIVVSVNFSRLHLRNRNFVKELCEVIDNVGIDRAYIEIEITETIAYDHLDTFETLLADLHENGLALSMDDFGSGCSSLGMLKDLPVDLIKMDRSFFINQKNANRSKIVVGNIIHMARELGIRTVAEGIEEQTHIDLLQELHCDMVQGYYYAKPMPAENFTKLIQTPNKFKGG